VYASKKKEAIAAGSSKIQADEPVEERPMKVIFSLGRLIRHNKVL
jgi:hypothetical protein